MRIRWSPEAADDLEGWISLRTFPYRSRSGRVKGSRELVFTNLPYIVVYRVIEETVEISRIYHGAQNWS
jgi:toxin ParE1/3/4